MEEIIKERRQHLTNAIKNNLDPAVAIHGLLQINCPLDKKFTRLGGFSVLLENNCETVDGLKKLLTMLNILEKYGRHLLKPADQRSSMWRHIKNSNTIYRDRVARIWGGKYIMTIMGYTEDRDDGVAFPEGKEPDHEVILELVADIILGKKELEAYLGANHPYPQHIEEHLNKELLSMLKQKTADGSGDNQASKASSGFPHSTLSGTKPGSIPSQIQSQDAAKRKEVQPVDMEAQNENRAQSIVCDICGKNQADIVCHVCDNKQLCGDCDTKWHSHPKRQNHQRQKLSLGETPSQLSPQPCVGAVGTSNQNQPRTVLRELPQRESESVYSPPSHTLPSNPSSSPNQQIYQTLLKPGTGGSMVYDPMIYHVPTSVPQSPLMYQPQYPPHNLLSQPRILPGMWTSNQPGSGQYFTANHMIGTSHMPGDSHIAGTSQMPGTNLIQGGAQNRVGQSMQYPFSVAGELREGREVRGSFPGFNQDFPQSHTLAYLPTSYARTSTPSPASADPMSLHRYSSSSPRSHGDLGFPGNQVRPASPVVYVERPNIADESVDTSIKSENTLKRSASHLVLKLKAIPDLERRRARLDIDLATLKGDIEEWDAEINQIIVDKEDFFQDKTYQNLNNRKRKHLREIKELEKYEEELDKIIADRIKEQEASRKKEELTEVRQRLNQGVIGDANGQGINIANVNNPPTMSESMMSGASLKNVLGNGPKGIAGQTKEHLHGRKGPENSTSQKVPVVSSANEENDNIRNDQEERKKSMEKIRKMFVLDQNPFSEPSPKQDVFQMNIPVSGTTQEKIKPDLMAGEGVSYPPKITESGAIGVQADQNMESKITETKNDVVKPKTGSIQQKASEPNLVTKGKEEQPVKKVLSEADLQLWECEHCTFVNEHSNNVCAVCCKTNDQKRIIALSGMDLQPNKPGGTGSRADSVEQCKRCTFHNDKGADICQMCGESLPKKIGLPKQDQLVAPATGGTNQGKKDAVSPRVTSLEQKLEEEQDQVLKEKKEAHRRYQQSLEVEQRNKNNAAQGADTAVDESTFVFVEGPVSGQLLEQGSTVGSAELVDRKPANKNMASLKKPLQQSPTSSNESYYTPPSSFDMLPLASEGHVIDRRPPASVNFNEAIEHIQMRRAQEQLSIDGRDFVMLIKAAEQKGFGLDEIEMSVSHCVEDKMTPIDWLKNKWVELIEIVVDMVSQKGKLPGNDDVGELYRNEAKEELVRCKGNVEEAVDACMKSRKMKFKEISRDGDYSKDQILTALYQNKGNVENTIHQLNSYVIKNFSDHLWIEPDPEGEAGSPHRTLVRAEGALPLGVAGLGAVGGLGAEASDGAVDSVISKPDFQEMIKNKTVDKERRIRMVFVEGKLQSWGRAETVIIILDTEADQLKDVVDCSLDDIVEAVKNCGDRKRSLGYLKQECGICFSYYPMNKIQNLNSCQCKLCRECLKQNFEVAIREKYVRNWVCPLCQAPDLEDETAATAYFEFLQLLLRTLVDQELKDLFETKLRDWHLQKEVNFRWCAHCASGFVWDRPDVSAMTCPHCYKKTCFSCKKQWEDQHQGLTCEEFTQWKIDNDPSKQAIGLARHLEENGIDCPSCKMRYDLAKGGCMHFRCPQCGHEFCSGCSEPFMQDGTCKLLKDCKGKGLHCHHPRDCFYYLRDNDIEDLQALLKQNKVAYNTETPASQKDPRHCPVMEQKEYGVNKKDEACGKDTQRGMAGLCANHYKEYLVGLINKNKVDPVDIMSVHELERCFSRRGRQTPKPKNENEAQYRKRLAQMCRESLPLRR